MAKHDDVSPLSGRPLDLPDIPMVQRAQQTLKGVERRGPARASRVSQRGYIMQTLERQGDRWEPWEDDIIKNPPLKFLHGPGRPHAGKIDLRAVADHLKRSVAVVGNRRLLLTKQP